MVSIEVLTEFVANIITFLFNIVGDIDLTPIADALEYVTPFLKGALYFLPVDTIAHIFGIACAIWSLRLTVKTVILVWNLLPIA